jgi:hypothetical protein
MILQLYKIWDTSVIRFSVRPHTCTVDMSAVGSTYSAGSKIQISYPVMSNRFD